ncbi:hypothetical protein [Halalkalicoccus sp. NIPERK01]|uniref:hypothetical protein n=1 Tax=Halalkalicoccus sp. NIPERK01 TaxID=3053469 RepID=UPI00256F2679|nr:hypothetical protein [Halalkalicoccus sp. NIPERK01]MDL5360736.1 hypothetical protein [Halalkalicoccus sp. NIPERK01]
MTRNRRGFLGLAAVGAGSVVGCIDLPFTERYQFRRGGSIRTEEALVADTGISFDSAYPHQYFALITTRSEAERVRWEYIREEDQVFAAKFEDTDFEEGFLTFAGLVLPKTKQLESDATTFDGSAMESTYRVMDTRDESDELAVQTVVEYWVRDAKAPTKFSVAYTYNPPTPRLRSVFESLCPVGAGQPTGTPVGDPRQAFRSPHPQR